VSDSLRTSLLALLGAVIVSWMWVRRRALRQFLAAVGPWFNPRPGPATGPVPSPNKQPLDAWLLVASVAVFAATRFSSLDAFPIYFFTDEAANTVMAADLVRDGFFDASGHFFPTYFDNGGKLSLSLSVYVQVIPYLLFGRSVLVTRATAALIALSGTVAVALMLRNVFRVRSAWLGVLLLTITPAWFLHSRTAFETSLYVAMFAWFLYFYLRYRQGHQPALLSAVAFAGLAFYSYNAGQVGLLLAGFLLFIVDLRYHWENRRVVALGLLLAGIVALPYLRFQAEHPGEVVQRLGQLDSYMVHPNTTLAERVVEYASEYALGLSPRYWYAPDNGRDLIRHRMKDYGNILWPTLPLGLLGIALALRHRRDPAHRAVLIAAFTAPAGAALAKILVTRVLVFVVPMAVLSAMGAAELLGYLARRLGYSRAAIGAFGLFAVVSGLMLRDAVVKGPTWYSDYGLYGMQYGAREVFAETSSWLAQHPESQVWIFPTWLNGSDTLRRFFAPDEPRIHLLSLDSFLAERFQLLDDAALVLSQDDFLRVTESGKFANVHVYRTLPLPDGRAGFHLVRMGYSADADAIFSRENEPRP
jgi:4-amino-4-deoxy-L-arabinose transferase-like glycosyltransferase